MIIDGCYLKEKFIKYKKDLLEQGLATTWDLNNCNQPRPSLFRVRWNEYVLQLHKSRRFA